MEKDIELILSKSVGEVIASPLSLKLLKCYSKLYLNGKAPRTCSNSQRKYYNRLKKDGLEMAKKIKKAVSRTCIPKWKGNKYIPKAGRHYNSSLITDEEATALLEKGYLKETDFEKLPEIKEENPEVSTDNGNSNETEGGAEGETQESSSEVQTAENNSTEDEISAEQSVKENKSGVNKTTSNKPSTGAKK